MNYALTMTITGNRTTGKTALARVRVCGGTLDYCRAIKNDAQMQVGDNGHPLGRIAAYVRAMNNEFGATSIVFAIKEEE